MAAGRFIYRGLRVSREPRTKRKPGLAPRPVVGRKRLKSGVTGETHEHATYMLQVEKARKRKTQTGARFSRTFVFNFTGCLIKF